MWLRGLRQFYLSSVNSLENSLGLNDRRHLFEDKNSYVLGLNFYLITALYCTFLRPCKILYIVRISNGMVLSAIFGKKTKQNMRG